MDAGNWIAIYAAVTSTALGAFQIISWRHERRRLQDLERREYRTALDLSATVQLTHADKTPESGRAVSVALRVENVSRNDAHIQFAAATIERDSGVPPLTGMFEVIPGRFDPADGPVALPLALAPGRVVQLAALLPLGPYAEALPGPVPGVGFVGDHGLGKLHCSVWTAEREFKHESDLSGTLLLGITSWG